MQEWEEVRKYGVPLLTWWEVIIKPGIKKLAIERGKELSKERRALLNLLMLRQSFLTRKVPTKEEMKESISTSNLHAAPGTDGITSYLYHECFEILGDALTDVAKAVH